MTEMNLYQVTWPAWEKQQYDVYDSFVAVAPTWEDARELSPDEDAEYCARLGRFRERPNPTVIPRPPGPDDEPWGRKWALYPEDVQVVWLGTLTDHQYTEPKIILKSYNAG